jgi:hypothetical protein
MTRDMHEMLVNVSFSVEGCIRGDMEVFDDSMLVFNILGIKRIVQSLMFNVEV